MFLLILPLIPLSTAFKLPLGLKFTNFSRNFIKFIFFTCIFGLIAYIIYFYQYLLLRFDLFIINEYLQNFTYKGLSVDSKSFRYSVC